MSKPTNLLAKLGAPPNNPFLAASLLMIVGVIRTINIGPVGIFWVVAGIIAPLFLLRLKPNTNKPSANNPNGTKTSGTRREREQHKLEQQDATQRYRNLIGFVTVLGAVVLLLELLAILVLRK